jgi:hypothetical protein
MSRAIRGEPSPDEKSLSLRRSLLDIASGITANGGPQSAIDQGYIDSARAAGISEIEIKAAAASKRPVLKGLEEFIRIDNF